MDDARPPLLTRIAARLTPGRCRLLAAAFIAFGFVSHLLYLRIDPPIDLSGDEAHYWDWSRQLGLGYYSKGPLVAYLIRASCFVFGDVMWAVRLPALVCAALVSAMTYWLTRRCFASEPLALGATLLSAAVPMFIAGSLLMTIDPPMMVAFAAATCVAAAAVLGDRPRLWPLAGVAIGIGALAKYGALAWYLGIVTLLLIEPRARRHARTPWFWAMLPLTLACLLPPILWNARHGWVSALHVGTQTGAVAGESRGLPINPLNTLEMLASQWGAVGPVLAVLLAIATVQAIGLVRRSRRDGSGATPPPALGDATTMAIVADATNPPPLAADTARALRVLLAVGVTFFVATAVMSLRTKIQANWPAPAYFTLLIVTAWWLARSLRSRAAWQPVRGWFWYGVVGLAIVATPILHEFPRIYPAVSLLNRVLSLEGDRAIQARQIDPSFRLLGWQQLGQRLGRESAGGEFILAEDYQVASQAAFYTPGQPRTFYAGSHFADPRVRRRLTQFDVWPDRQLDQPSLLGRDAIYVGYMNEHLASRFERVEPLADEEIWRGGLKVRRFLLHRCIGFKGMTRPSEGTRH